MFNAVFIVHLSSQEFSNNILTHTSVVSIILYCKVIYEANLYMKIERVLMYNLSTQGPTWWEKIKDSVLQPCALHQP
jgi:hypothetical protein